MTCISSSAVWLFGPFALFAAGLNILYRILEYGLLPNHNYVDPIDGVPIIDNGEIVKPSAAIYPQKLYREEWDDMIKDPISEAVIQQREELLPDAIRGDINDEDNISDAYSLAYMTITPDSLNWTKYIREAGKMYNKFINRIGDNFIYTWIILPFLTYNYFKLVNEIVNKYYATNSSFFDIKRFAMYTIGFAVVIGVLHALMTPVDADETEFDGVETKCYGDIETPFTVGTGPLYYPKLCFGESTKEDKPECPYGCYYIGDGSTPVKKCKDNRSLLTLGGFLDPEPTLNIPWPGDVKNINVHLIHRSYLKNLMIHYVLQRLRGVKPLKALDIIQVIQMIIVKCYTERIITMIINVEATFHLMVINIHQTLLDLRVL